MYTSSIYQYVRRQSREVAIGDVKLGGNNPIRVQSMTNTPTQDTNATVAQLLRMYEAGCEYARITTPTMADAENLVNIKKALNAQGVHMPLIADVHFNPKVAEAAARIVEKVRINPGNYYDRKSNITQKREFSEADYARDLEQIATRLSPLLSICKQYGTAIRIGTNHGSLSERILNKYGNTPMGMAVSAMEFVDICHNFGFHNLVLSMKSSNLMVMIESTRQLVELMAQKGYDYPIHLGVTEAGAGTDGRIKSVAGIDTLLADGIGDTIRVSLTEDPEVEIPVAASIVKPYNNKKSHSITATESLFYNPYTYQRRNTTKVKQIGGRQQIRIIANNDNLCEDDIPLETFNQEYAQLLIKEPQLQSSEVAHLNNNPETVVVLSPKQNELKQYRNIIAELEQNHLTNPVVLRLSDITHTDWAYDVLRCSLFVADGLIDALWLDTTNPNAYEITSAMLQCFGQRHVKAEIISCPSCGRTQYHIMQVLAEAKERLSHLKYLKIGVMGCIVNGPGEMAGANYGVVGSGKNEVTLYANGEPVERHIPEQEAVTQLVELIKSKNDWIDAK